jgi:hypothetical protein
MDLPPRLGEQQQFILAAVLVELHPYGEAPRMPTVSERVAAEFDESGERRHDARRRSVSESHSASVSRSVTRLGERGFVERKRALYESGKSHRVTLTDDGYSVAQEILRRCRDGRYSLSFDTLDASGVPA